MNTVLNHHTKFTDLGLIDYQQAWDYQTSLFNSILEVKSKNRTAVDSDQLITDNFLLFCEHPHVYTLGKSGNEDHLLIKKEELSAIGATYHHINRGGDITYHGPGQLVGYPILDLENFFTDIHQYMRLLEEAVIQTLAEFNITAGRVKGLTGVWLGIDDPGKQRKICAMGVKTSRWVTLHGFALNVNTDLTYFDKMIPCGIQDKSVTSMQKELKSVVDLDIVKRILKEKLAELFNMDLRS